MLALKPNDALSGQLVVSAAGACRVIEDAGYSAKDLNRPGITQALQMVESRSGRRPGRGQVDRLSRSLLDFAAPMDRARRKKWALAALDLGVDTSTPSGEMMANVVASFAQFERRLIGQRTKDALAVKKRRVSAWVTQDSAPRPGAADQDDAVTRIYSGENRCTAEPGLHPDRTRRSVLVPLDRPRSPASRTVKQRATTTGRAPSRPCTAPTSSAAPPRKR